MSLIRTVEDPSKIMEHQFQREALGRQESLMTQGNGYMGIRGTHEEYYASGIRGFYIAGTYNKDSEHEVAELPNLADILEFEITLDGEAFRLDTGTVLYYRRYLDLKNGGLTRKVMWQSKSGRQYELCFRRFVALDNLHLVVSKVEITPITGDSSICVKTGINGRMTNSGTQNMREVEKRVFESRYMYYVQKTTQSEIYVTFASILDTDEPGNRNYISERRKLLVSHTSEVQHKTKATFVKKTIVSTSLDKERCDSLALLKTVEHQAYEYLFEKSCAVWEQYSRIEIESENNFDLFAIRFAEYHLRIMVPAHDSRYSIGAKGLTGEGYKAHVFWDTEIFLLPYYLYTNPEMAKKLLIYRYNNLGAAKEKALSNGYRGCLFPWESALTGQEETPEFAAMNIKTGLRERVHSADKEHHIVADIGYGILEYEKATADDVFMNEMGLEMLVDISRFWVSRADKNTKPYAIRDVIGPDEYTEHVDNNAYTNYMAYYVVKSTLEKVGEYGYPLTEYDSASFEDFTKFIYLPLPDKNGVIPQDDTFLSKPVIDLEKYRGTPGTQAVLQDYTREEVVGMQILKQADVVMLLYALPALFSREAVHASWNYYEPKTIHDSSLSMCIHSIVALQFGDAEKAYECFEKGSRIDLGEKSDCRDGIHAASLGAVYLAVVFGFCGVSVKEREIHLKPRLPRQWRSICFPFVFRGEKLRISINQSRILVTRESRNGDVSLDIDGQKAILRQDKNYLEIKHGGNSWKQ